MTLLGAAVLIALAGCGNTVSRSATEQLLTSDAVDRSVSRIDFRAFAGKKVYLDTQYLQHVKEAGFVNAAYVTSSLRQQMVAARCRLQDKKEDADYVVEVRVGALGTDRHEVTYGIPANNFLSTAASVVPTAPPLPTIPEISVAKRNDQLGAAKIAAFGYHRETGQPVWQSGLSDARSNAKDSWLLGAGPFQRGTIYDGTQFAGNRLELNLLGQQDDEEKPLVAYDEEAHFGEPATVPQVAAVPSPEDPPADDDSKPEGDPPEAPPSGDDEPAAKPQSPPDAGEPAEKPAPLDPGPSADWQLPR